MRKNLAAVLLLSGCVRALTVTVQPGDSLSDSLDLLSPGDTLFLSPGTYTSSGSDPLLSCLPEHSGTFILSSASDRAVLQGGGAQAPVVEITGPASMGIFLGNLVITGGNATGDEYFNGGGVHCDEASVVLSNCLLTGNSALIGGGLGAEGSTVQAHFCTFSNNQAVVTGGGVDLYASDFSGFTLTFTGNQSGDDGGGLNSYQSSVVLDNGLFTGNLSGDDGGGACILQGSAQVSFSTFHGNDAVDDGGGLRIHTIDSMLIRSSLVTGNTGKAGINVISTVMPQVEYVCCWGNEFSEYHGMDDPTGTMGNISVDPVYADQWLNLSQTAAGQPNESPAVNAGHCAAGDSPVAEMSTRTDSIPDAGTADMGFHHINAEQTGIQGSSTGGSRLTVSPSPAAAGSPLHFHGLPREMVTMYFYDTCGRILGKTELQPEGSTSETVSPGTLPRGLVLIRAVWSTGSSTVKLVVCE